MQFIHICSTVLAPLLKPLQNTYCRILIDSETTVNKLDSMTHKLWVIFKYHEVCAWKSTFKHAYKTFLHSIQKMFSPWVFEPKSEIFQLDLGLSLTLWDRQHSNSKTWKEKRKKEIVISEGVRNVIRIELKYFFVLLSRENIRILIPAEKSYHLIHWPRYMALIPWSMDRSVPSRIWYVPNCLRQTLRGLRAQRSSHDKIFETI